MLLDRAAGDQGLFLSLLPHEILVHVLSWLDLASLGAMMQVSRSINKVGASAVLWDAQLGRFMDAHRNVLQHLMIMREMESRDSGRSRYLLELAVSLFDTMNIARSRPWREAQLQAQSRGPCEKALRVVFIYWLAIRLPFLLIASLVAALTLLVFVILASETNVTFSSPWKILSPGFALGAIALLDVAVEFVLLSQSGNQSSLFFRVGMFTSMNAYLRKNGYIHSQAEYVRLLKGTLLVICATLVFLALLCLSLEGAVQWTVAFIPIWMAGFYFAVDLIAMASFHAREPVDWMRLWQDALCPFVFLACFVTCSILLALLLQGVIFVSLSVVLVPVWFAIGLQVALWLQSWRSTKHVNLMKTACGIVLEGLGLTSLVLLCVRVDKNANWPPLSVVLSPLFLGLSLIFAALLVKTGLMVHRRIQNV